MICTISDRVYWGRGGGGGRRDITCIREFWRMMSEADRHGAVLLRLSYFRVHVFVHAVY